LSAQWNRTDCEVVNPPPGGGPGGRVAEMALRSNAMCEPVDPEQETPPIEPPPVTVKLQEADPGPRLETLGT